MTLCRKCGKEIPDGEELCEDCKNEESQMDEAYLEELMQSMSDEEKEPENAGEPAPVMDEQVEEKPAEEASDGEADVNELLTLLSQDYEDYDEPDSAVQPEEEVQTAEPMDESPAETSLFREDDEESVFADDADALSVDDIMMMHFLLWITVRQMRHRNFLKLRKNLFRRWMKMPVMILVIWRWILWYWMIVKRLVCPESRWRFQMTQRKMYKI